MTWRRAFPSDDDDIARMSHALYVEDPSPETIDPPQIRKTLERLRNEPARGVAAVLDIDGTLLGYALLVSFWSNELGGEICTIDEVYVDASARSRGHMTALARSIIAGEM